MTVNCPPTTGRRYFLIVELDGQGTHQTINYYPKEQVSSTPGSYPYTFNASVGSRTLFIVSADDQQASQLENAPDGYLINNLPPGTQYASSPVTSTRTP